jgi:hypothetical protein
MPAAAQVRSVSFAGTTRPQGDHGGVAPWVLVLVAGIAALAVLAVGALTVFFLR